MTNKRSRGLGSLEVVPIRMNRDNVIISMPSNVELWQHDSVDDNLALKNSCHAGNSACSEGPLVRSLSPPKAGPGENDDSVTDQQGPCRHLPCHCHRDCSATASNADMKTKLRAQHAKIVRRALHLSKDDCVVDTTAIMTPKHKAVLLSNGRGRAETSVNGDHHENHFIPVANGHVEHSFQLSALASALPLYDLGEELWQKELSFLFGPMGPAFGGRGERSTCKNGRKRELPLSPDLEKLGQQRSNTDRSATPRGVAGGKEAYLFCTTSISSSSPDQTLSFPTATRMIPGEMRHHDQEPHEVVERSDVQIGLSESPIMVVSPLKRQRRTTSISPTSSNTCTTGLRRASMNFNDLPSL